MQICNFLIDQGQVTKFKIDLLYTIFRINSHNIYNPNHPLPTTAHRSAHRTMLRKKTARTKSKGKSKKKNSVTVPGNVISM